MVGGSIKTVTFLIKGNLKNTTVFSIKLVKLKSS